jgi:hypothetical protein
MIFSRITCRQEITSLGEAAKEISIKNVEDFSEEFDQKTELFLFCNCVNIFSKFDLNLFT